MNIAERIHKGLYWDRAWSLVEGCTSVSEACQNCWSAEQTYMRQFQKNEKMSVRYKGLVNDQGRFNGTIRLMESELEKPLHVRRPTTWAIWNDLFHEDVPDEFIAKALTITGYRPEHTFLLLTKRVKRMREFLAPRYSPLLHQNIWVGVTIESFNYLWRMEHLLMTPAHIRFVSIEPMLGPIDLAGDDGGQHFFSFENEQGTITPGVDWVIIGAESGSKRRPMKLEWVRDLVKQCQDVEVPVFIKQLHINGRLSRNMAEWPEDLRIRQLMRRFPS